MVLALCQILWSKLIGLQAWVGILWSSFNFSHINNLRRLLQYYLRRVIITSNLLPLIISITIVSFQLVSLGHILLSIMRPLVRFPMGIIRYLLINYLSPASTDEHKYSFQMSRPSEFIYQGLWSRDSDNEAITIHDQSYTVMWHSNWHSKKTYLMGRHQIKIKPYLRHRVARRPEEILGKKFTWIRNGQWTASEGEFS